MFRALLPASTLPAASLALIAAALIVVNADAALPKPKPWQWTPQKTVVRLSAARPIVGGEVGDEILDARCTPQGRGVAGRFSRFTCEARWGGSNGSYKSILSLRILAIGTGKLCVVTTLSSSGEAVAVPYTPNTGGTRIKPERVCP